MNENRGSNRIYHNNKIDFVSDTRNAVKLAASAGNPSAAVAASAHPPVLWSSRRKPGESNSILYYFILFYSLVSCMYILFNLSVYWDQKQNVLHEILEYLHSYEEGTLNSICFDLRIRFQIRLKSVKCKVYLEMRNIPTIL